MDFLCLLFVCHLFVIFMLFVCHLFITCLLFGCYLVAIWLSFACYYFAILMLLVCYLLAICLLYHTENVMAELAAKLLRPRDAEYPAFCASKFISGVLNAANSDAPKKVFVKASEQALAPSNHFSKNSALRVIASAVPHVNPMSTPCEPKSGRNSQAARRRPCRGPC